MNQDKLLIDAVVEGIEEKKGTNIHILDMSSIDGAICQYMIISEGKNPTQVDAIYQSVYDKVREKTAEKPLSFSGVSNAEWIGIDYGTVMVHIFMPETRSFYNIENLWSDAVVHKVANLD